jgi:integrase
MPDEREKRPRRKLTARTLNALPPGPKKGTWHPDADLPGFFVVSYPAALVFYVRVRIGSSRRVIKIGHYGALTPAQARTKAKELLSSAALGGNPAEARETARRMPTYSAWARTYLERIGGTKKSPREDRRFLPMAEDRWGGRALDSLTSEDVLAFRQSLAETPTQANRWLASVRAMLSAAVVAGHIRTNPARGIKPFLEAPPRARVLDAAEMERLLVALKAESDPHSRAAVHLLIESGARLSEALHARWEDVDFSAGTWRIPSPKAGRPQTVPLAKDTLSMLRKLPRVGPFIIPGRRPEKPRSDLKGVWNRLLGRAKLENVHVHDVRRTFGLAVAKAAGLHVASKLLRHADVRVTERVYAPLGIEDLRAAVEARAAILPFASKKKAAGRGGKRSPR